MARLVRATHDLRTAGISAATPRGNLLWRCSWVARTSEAMTVRSRSTSQSLRLFPDQFAAGQPFAQLALQYLARGVLRQGVDEHDVLGLLVAGDARAAEGDQLL